MKINSDVEAQLLQLAEETVHLTPAQTLNKNTPCISKKLLALTKLQTESQKILIYTEKLKSESIANVGQVLTISKQRIMHPCKTNDILAGIILSNELMELIDERLKKIYIGN